jgi:beta-glucosidase-like glycosyl hydrolase
VTARLVFPALRWSPTGGYGVDDPAVERWLAAGVGGFLVFGGVADEAEATLAELSARAERPLIYGADLERGAGQQLAGCTPLPPAMALASLGPDVVREAAALTAREAASVGIRWLFAPVADVAVEPDNPIVATRALGRDPASAAAGVTAWVEGALAEGGIPCLKHFPGHGRTTEDSHETMPTVDAPLEDLEAELEPFRAGLAAGAPSVMTAHVAFPAFDPSGRPATRSRVILKERLRQSLGFEGVIATDALIMGAIGSGPDEGALEPLEAGVDALLYPPEPDAVLAALVQAEASGRLSPSVLRAATDRVDALVRRAAASEGGRGPDRSRADDLERARGWAEAAARVPDAWPCHAGRLKLEIVDDDVGGPYDPPPREPLVRALSEAGLRTVGESSDDGPLVIAVFADPRGWKGRAGLSAEAADRVAAMVAVARAAARPTGIALFGDPVRASDLPAGVPVLDGWGGEWLMQEAVAALISRRRDEAC